MANLKNIADLPVAESAEGLNLIVEQDGAAKRVAADAVCKVKSVNGVEPDESGNVEIEIPDSFSGSWDDLTDKPFYSEVETKIAVEQQIAEFVHGDEVYQYPITLPSDIYDSKEVDILWDGVTYRIDGAELKDHDYDCPDIDGSGNCIFCIREIRGQVYIQTFDGSPTHEIGITYINETVHKLDAKYLPNSGGYSFAFKNARYKRSNTYYFVDKGLYDAIKRGEAPPGVFTEFDEDSDNLLVLYTPRYYLVDEFTGGISVSLMLGSEVSSRQVFICDTDEHAFDHYDR